MILRLRMRHFVSFADRFLKKFDKNHSKLTASQEAERKKFEAIFQKRDEKK